MEIEEKSRIRPQKKSVPKPQVQAEGWPGFCPSNESKTVYGTDMEHNRIASVNIWKFSSNYFLFSQ